MDEQSQASAGADGPGPRRGRPGRSPAVVWAMGLLGAALGGGLGFWLFVVIVRQGFYAIVLPGALLGLGCGILMRQRCTALGVVCAVLGLAVGILAEWYVFPFRADHSLGYFLANLHELRPFTLAMIALGGFLAFWFGRGRDDVFGMPVRRAANGEDDEST